jgi:hypothetical protein
MYVKKICNNNNNDDNNKKLSENFTWFTFHVFEKNYLNFEIFGAKLKRVATRFPLNSGNEYHKNAIWNLFPSIYLSFGFHFIKCTCWSGKKYKFYV